MQVWTQFNRLFTCDTIDAWLSLGYGQLGLGLLLNFCKPVMTMTCTSHISLCYAN